MVFQAQLVQDASVEGSTLRPNLENILWGREWRGTKTLTSCHQEPCSFRISVSLRQRVEPRKQTVSGPVEE